MNPLKLLIGLGAVCFLGWAGIILYGLYFVVSFGKE